MLLVGGDALCVGVMKSTHGGALCAAGGHGTTHTLLVGGDGALPRVALGRAVAAAGASRRLA